jgi:hypothetical protein
VGARITALMVRFGIKSARFVGYEEQGRWARNFVTRMVVENDGTLYNPKVFS